MRRERAAQMTENSRISWCADCGHRIEDHDDSPDFGCLWAVFEDWYQRDCRCRLTADQVRRKAFGRRLAGQAVP
jgi:hypothetical protein